MVNTLKFVEYHQIDDWKKACNLLNELSEGNDSILFRGQRESTWGLTSSFARKHPPMEWISSQLEYQLTRQFEKGIKAYLPNQTLSGSQFELLTLMQGHGLSTRLVSFTRSPFIAVYFAFENAAKSEYSTVWAIRDGILKCQNHDQYNSDVGRFDIGKIYLHRNKTNDEIDSLLERDIKGIIPIEPSDADAKSIAQQITFLLPTTLSTAFEDLISLYFKKSDDPLKKFKTPVVKIDISSKLRPKILSDLNLMNINGLTLFPGLEGFLRPEYWGTNIF